MSSRKQVKWLRSGLLIGSAALAVCLIALACNRQPSSSESATVEAGKGRPAADEPTAQCPVQARRAEVGSNKTAQQPPVAEPRRPLTPRNNEIQQARPVDPAAGEYALRLEALRSLLLDARRHGQTDQAIGALGTLLDEVERQEGPAMAQRVAMAEAGNLQAQKDYLTAARAYEVLLDRYPQSAFVAEATYQLADCRLELHDYAAAEQIWRKLIDEYGDSVLASWAWRKLALAQLLQTHYDQSLVTLEAMAARYAGTEFEEYARMRRGYVLAAGGRSDQARAAYQAFLKDFPRSKYCGLASKQMAELEAGVALVRTTR
jgi:TolA-binding protein